ncbi:hypothetical protein [Streptomyces sp. NPDC048663]|uniref:hypothetical protein n=1 Tax=Streptomyces sp. NPDC048663 TaxID=3155638 RepID=UPI0034456777
MPAPDGPRRRARFVVRRRRPGAEEAVLSEESAPPRDGAAGPPRGLLQRMAELMAALNADLSDLHREAGLAGRDAQECADTP